MEYTKLTLEMTSPEWSAYFQGLPAATRARVQDGQAALSKGISSETINAIHDALYARSLDGHLDTTLITATEVTGATRDGDGWRLGLRHTETGEAFALSTGAVVLATGYAPGVPSFLDPVASRIRFDDRGRFLASATYSIDHDDREIFVQNAEEHTHGFVAPDLGMGADAQLGDHRRDARPRGLPGGEADRLPGVRGAGPAAARWTGGSPMRLTVEPLDLERDLGLLHRWVTHPRSVYWGMQGATRAEVAQEYAHIAEDPHHEALLGRADGVPQFLVERYDPFHVEELSPLPELEPGDVGMHLLVAPTESPGARLHRRRDAPGRRHLPRRGPPRGGRAGRPQREDRRPQRRRRLLGGAPRPTERQDRRAQRLRPRGLHDLAARARALRRGRCRMRYDDHLRPELLERAQRHLVAKAISEFSHERLLTPTAVSLVEERAPASVSKPRTYTLTTPGSLYSFTARVHPLEHWVLDEESLTRTVDGRPADLDVQELVVELAEVLGIPDPLLPTYLEELAATLAAATWKLAHSHLSAADLVDGGLPGRSRPR